jgi:hypothetical protein
MVNSAAKSHIQIPLSPLPEKRYHRLWPKRDVSGNTIQSSYTHTEAMTNAKKIMKNHHRTLLLPLASTVQYCTVRRTVII